MSKTYYILLDKDYKFMKIVNQSEFHKLVHDFNLKYNYYCTRYCDELLKPYIYLQPIILNVSADEFMKILGETTKKGLFSNE